ncbi:MAG: transporter [Bacteroidaceae bacterium]|nr:transporter [Bacteroidaceae bacterium]
MGFTADRPGATTGTDVLPRGRVQWESGVAWERSKLDGATATTWTLNTSLFRWGFSDFAELRLQADYLSGRCGGIHTSGFSDVALGTKARLFDGWKSVPAISLLANVLLPGGSDADYLPQHFGGQMGLLFQNQFASWCSLGYEADLVWSDSRRPTVFFGLCLSFSLSDRLSLVVEQYNTNTSDNTECWSELSLAYQLTPPLQLDLGTDLSLNHFGDYRNAMIGVAWQITK